jgi:hypothetical protein
MTYCISILCIFCKCYVKATDWSHQKHGIVVGFVVIHSGVEYRYCYRVLVYRSGHNLV